MPEKKNVVVEKSFDFAVRVVNAYKFLCGEKKEFVLSKQLLRSGTSIGANIRESQNAESTADFIHKLGIAQKEADETLYWLELLFRTEYLSAEQFRSLENDLTQILKLIRSVIITSKAKNRNS
jgi:four helix bundle protein